MLIITSTVHIVTPTAHTFAPSVHIVEPTVNTVRPIARLFIEFPVMCDAENKCIVHDRGQNLVIWQMNTKLSLSLLFHACVWHTIGSCNKYATETESTTRKYFMPLVTDIEIILNS